MKIAIVGLGVAGAYLSSRLSEGNYVVGYERLKREKFDAVCAWGTSKYGISDLVRKIGLNFEDYLLHEGRYMSVDLGDDLFEIRLKGLCTFNKVKLVQDMINADKVYFGRSILNLPQEEEYDFIIDATGLYRPLLPRVEKDIWIPCVQYLVKFREPPFDDFYIRPFKGLTGYFWYFPLGDSYAHVGAGDFYKRHNEELNTFLKQHICEVVKKVGRPVRITPPSRCTPFSQGKVVGVGESIGTVYPLLGEGIIPSLQCSELFIENMYDHEAYQRKVIEKFRIFDKVFQFIKAKIEGNFSLTSQSLRLLSVYLHMKSCEQRYGMEIRLRDMLRVVRS